MAKIPPAIPTGEGDLPKKRKATGDVATAKVAKKRKGGADDAAAKDSVVEPGAAPVAEEVVATRSEPVLAASVPEAPVPTTIAPARASATFPRFMARGFLGVADTQSPQSPEIVDVDIGSRRGCTSFTIPSTDAGELHRMLGAAIQVCPVPEFLVAEFQRLGTELISPLQSPNS